MRSQRCRVPNRHSPPARWRRQRVRWHSDLLRHPRLCTRAGVRLRTLCASIGARPRRLTPCPHMAIVMAMSLSEHLSLADVKNRLSEVVDRLEREHGRVVVTKHGRPAAVMLNVDDLESLEETLEILSNPGLVEAIREGTGDVAAGRTGQLSRDEALDRIAKR